MDNRASVSRRGFIGAMGASALSPGLLASGQGAKEPRRRVYRIAHLTDAHVQPERAGGEGLAHCIELVEKTYAPDAIMHGGDQIMDAMGAGRERTKTQFDLWRRVVDETQRSERINVIGNHDVWGWSTDEAPDDPQYGKAWASDVFGLERPYYALDRAGWKIIVLDSTHPRGRGYTGKLDDEQFEWLEGEVRGAGDGVPIMIASHIPLLSACVFFDGNNEKTGDWRVPGAWMHIDVRRIKDLFHDAGNVKLCASGHLHLAERVEYLGTSYCCNGAVSGGWWGGDYHEFGPGFAIVDLYDDGSFENTFVESGWAARE